MMRLCATGAGGGFACGVFSTVLMAAVAALGVWVLRLTEKDGGPVKRAGQAVGWTLVVIGLLGFLCGSVSHATKGWSRDCHAQAGGSDMKLPQGHPPIDASGK